MFLRFYIFLVIAGHITLLSGCMSGHDPYLAAEQIANTHGWNKQIIETNRFDLLAYIRLNGTGDHLTIYLEGDGNAWRSRSSLSSDPTPKKPLVLQLASQDPSSNLVYLARPCQYVIQDGHGRNCSSSYWSTKRFAPEIVETLDEAITYLKEKTGAPPIHLVGYSGGGGLAVMVAAGRDDVASLRTIAGNLDHKEFTSYHRVSPLTESSNPADFANAVSSIPQIHFSGEKDRSVPSSIAEQFMARLSENNCATLVTVRGVSHSKGWQDVWQALLRMTPSCVEKQ